MTEFILSDYFIEIVDRSGVVRERVSLDENSKIIGRAYDCQVIVDDPYVCPQHVKVTLAENGELLVEDVGSINGLSADRHGSKHAQLKLQPGDDCFIGWTKLRYHRRSEKVAPARRDHSRQLVLSALLQPKFLALIIIIPFFQLLYSTWLEQAREGELYTLLLTPATVYFVLVIWASFWSVVGKLLVHRAMFFTHLAIISAMTGLTTLVEGATAYSVFIFDVDDMKNTVLYTTGFFITAATMYAHLHFASRGKPKSQAIAAIFVSMVILMLSVYVEIEDNSQFSSSPRYSASIKSPMFVIGTVQTTEDFLSSLDGVESEVDALKKKD
jgi:hypothetical protein